MKFQKGDLIQYIPPFDLLPEYPENEDVCIVVGFEEHQDPIYASEKAYKLLNLNNNTYECWSIHFIEDPNCWRYYNEGVK